MAGVLTLANNNGYLGITCTQNATGWLVTLPASEGHIPPSGGITSVAFGNAGNIYLDVPKLFGYGNCPLFLAKKVGSTSIEIYLFTCAGFPPVGGIISVGSKITVNSMENINVLQSSPASTSLNIVNIQNVTASNGNIDDLYNIAAFTSFPYIDGKNYNMLSFHAARLANVSGYGIVQTINHGVSTHIDGFTESGAVVNENISPSGSSGCYRRLNIDITPPEIYFAESATTENILHVPMTASQGQVITGESDSVTIPDSALLEVAKATPPPEITVKYTGTSVPTVTDTTVTRSRKKVK